MRVIGGTAKGLALKGPKTNKGHIRPTSDKVREALFDILRDHVVHARVLDLYAGTGALAIEALSRGAESAALVEADREALALIQENLQRAGLNAAVHRGRVEKKLPLLGADYDLVLADPPYADVTLVALLPQLAGHLAAGGVLVIEHASRASLPDVAGNATLWKRRRHGDTTLSIYRQA
ncbi:MAG: 16S rRNA (guanine(966)-N(2))-methyltransferase RsmD [Chloroflexi bacterium]|nr:16S rRNA (guanine(966)-N(2))-methyltransferase RsmD [Chloroflexota bacterium]